ncbi:MAG: sulfur carrier protein ThiS [Bacteroidetes bacterium]|jgi:sulfur carrier protein|nr:sulfur carrier protein ThiS [Bacteroidota bacterium]MBT3748661.1 sulfur carrier protein ThiS [Bacteroidota bacterium]MBT4398335.1 sulfur carrier protein ThiS [Bacteroidota bacterium]MBT4409950.1 sulfur carrier protein ThiS [Bacteroidota bacterium]MBT5427452.1 sulfur carrier protein ThiS [Bacteroidota bacterium]
MIITLNNRQEEFDNEIMLVSEIMVAMTFTFPRVIVKLNGTLIKKPDYQSIEVKDGDVLEVIHLISGG